MSEQKSNQGTKRRSTRVGVGRDEELGRRYTLVEGSMSKWEISIRTIMTIVMNFDILVVPDIGR